MVSNPVLEFVVTAAAFGQLADPVEESGFSARFGPLGMAQECISLRAKLGGLKAVTATAHKLARIVYHRLSTAQAYDETVFAQQKLQNKQRNQRRLRQQTRKLGFELTQIPMEA
jgi:hypothetical protein